MRTDLFDFVLPEDLIALRPVSPRDRARLLVVRPGASNALEDRCVLDLPDLLEPGDALVFNDTRVIRSALKGRRINRGEPVGVHFNLHLRSDANIWQAFARPARRLRPGDQILLVPFDASGSVTSGVPALEALITDKRDGGEVTLQFNVSGASLDEAIAALGRMPLPPYIEARREAGSKDESDYQTIYATREGAVAAPTAGLHFTQRLLDAIDARGVSQHFVTLHVGAGTFLPVKAEDTVDHTMHAEWGDVSAETADALNDVRARGRRIVAVGTTSLRILESSQQKRGTISAFRGETQIFITPGYRVGAVDALMTNFHLPCSTLFMLVSAFTGLDLMKSAYAHAVEERYRFYSYGDATLLFPGAGPDDV